MCQHCNAQVNYGLNALEALANGEEMPTAEAPEVELVKYVLPFPVVMQVSDSGFTAIVTNEQGYRAIRGFLESIGQALDEDH